jgi:hypothetical protein
MRLNPWNLTIPLAVAIVLITIVVLRIAPPASCDHADASLRSGLVTQAQQGYLAILADEPESSCAARGMVELVETLCARAWLMSRGKAVEQAETVYVSVIAMEPQNWDVRCAMDGLAGLPEPESTPTCPCPPTCAPSSCVREVDDPDPDDPEVQQPEKQEAERQEAERQEAERQEAERQEPELQEPEYQEYTPWTG